ncbi:hypothetical protein [Ligilactobacillus aviarius]|uniref:hypothetical protein n=1 Tax=Ligilactobacillus aviarius TaxID=1606 RepID=UPI00255B4836|nr:hypothetical protein [Ligilactobacillus aviarius]
MTELEGKCLDFIKKHLAIISYSILLLIILGLYVQMGLHFDLTSPPSTDFNNCIQPWWNAIVHNGGFKSLSHPIGDYASSYQTFMAWMTTWGLNCQGAIKLVGAITNFALAFAVAALTYNLSSKKSVSNFAIPFLITLVLPSAFIESMIWGQCDPLYALFMVVCFYFFYKDKWGWGCFFYGLSLCFKLEPIIFLPFIVMDYVLEHKHSILNLGWTLLGFYIPNLGGILHGQSILSPIKTMLVQTQEQPKLSLAAINFPQLFTASNNDFAGEQYQMLSKFLIVITIFILAIALIWFNNKNFNVKNHFIQLVLWCIWTCEFFLPSMHERYDFMIGILLIVLTCLNMNYLPLLIGVATIDIIIYTNSFFGFITNFQPYAWMMMLLYCFMTYIIIKDPNKFKIVYA